ncbi:MAG: hypothetical protein B0A82_12515 [Alkalinema sp. CACIAM 70d]|nr:MAG: hypothetical protein B0A82_12515 [Alkalinema sp. CACIAM 70d]
MSHSVLVSTFLLTLLLAIGLGFFIRASVKDRTEIVQLTSDEPEDSLLAKLKQYFAERAYRVSQIDAQANSVVFEGWVRPSLFLAGFLSLLAGLGALCLVLVLSFLLPDFTGLWIGLLVFSPLAGVFYWRKAGRNEQVSLKVESEQAIRSGKSLITVKAHRDELAELQRTLNLKSLG